jgi:hypothetical protein
MSRIRVTKKEYRNVTGLNNISPEFEDWFEEVDHKQNTLNDIRLIAEFYKVNGKKIMKRKDLQINVLL